jgi:hypothetical protein
MTSSGSQAYQLCQNAMASLRLEHPQHRILRKEDRRKTIEGMDHNENGKKGDR